MTDVGLSLRPEDVPERARHWASRGSGRFAALDVARALAFAGMLLSHFTASMVDRDPGWLQAADRTADGRAAPLFCLLLGVGAVLLSARGTPGRVLVRRGLVLLGLGLAVWPYVEEVNFILPHYGLLLAIVPLLRRLPTAWLLPAATAAFAVPSVVAAVVAEPTLRTAVQPSTYGDLADVHTVLEYLLWTGAYPLVGWLGFALVGMWVGHQDLGRQAVRWRLLAGGTALVALQPVAALAYGALDRPEGQPAGLAAFLDGSAHSNRFAWYVLSSATAVAVIALCALLLPGDGASHPSARPVVALGQLALSAYLGHIVLGEELVWDWRNRTEPSLLAQMAVVAAVVAGFALVATAWRSRFRRGPLEAVVRILAGAR